MSKLRGVTFTPSRFAVTDIIIWVVEVRKCMCIELMVEPTAMFSASMLLRNLYSLGLVNKACNSQLSWGNKKNKKKRHSLKQRNAAVVLLTDKGLSGKSISYA